MELNLERLEERAFPSHEITYHQLLLYAFAERLGCEDPRSKTAEHIRSCPRCQAELRILHRTDPILNGSKTEPDVGTIVIH